MDKELIRNLGPLGALAGVWEGDQGVDIAPTPGGPVESRFREHLVMEPFGPVTYGALSNPFLKKSANTDAYEVTITINDDGSFSYAEDTILNFEPLGEIFHHTDGNTLRRVG